MSISHFTPEIRDFLETTGHKFTRASKLKGDMSTRQFWRLYDVREVSVVLMISLPEHHPNYAQGHSHNDYVRISQRLQKNGLRVPHIIQEDAELCLCLVEDIGDMTYTKCLEEGISNDILTSLAGRALQDLRDVDCQDLPDFMTSHVFKGHRRFVDWFYPVLKKEKISDPLISEFIQIWRDIFQSLPKIQNTFLHADYHFGNLMWNSQNEELPVLLDFQGAMQGPAAYDLANLLQDARRDVSSELHEIIYKSYLDTLSGQELESFELWYPVLATQFHCRVIGQFIKLALNTGNKSYLKHLPRLAARIDNNIRQNETLDSLKKWMDAQSISLAAAQDITCEDILPGNIREDAF